MSVTIDNTDHTAKGEDNRIQALTDALNALLGGGGVAAALVTGSNDSDAIHNFGFLPSQYAVVGAGTAPLVSISFVTDDQPGDETSAVTGGNLGSYFTRTSGDIGSMSAIELDTQKNSDGNVGSMSGASLFLSNNGAGTVGSFTGYNVNTDNEGAISGDVIGLNIGHLYNAGTVGGNTIGMRVQNPNGPGTTAGYAAGLDIQSVAGVATGDNHGVHIANHGTGAKDFALKTDGGRVCHDNTPVPTSASAAGRQGEIAWDSGFIYVCIATNTWKRAAIATWP